MKVCAIAADDHSIVLAGLRSILQKSGCELVETVTDGRALVEAADRLKPDLIFLDISMPVLNGIDAARQIRATNRRVRMIFLSMYTDMPYVRQAFQVGGNAYVLKSVTDLELGTALTEVMSGRRYVSPAITEESVEALLTAPAVNSFGRDLNTRQREVLQLVAEGRTNKEVAESLRISVKTVEYHKANVMSVLGLRTVAELTKYAVQQGMTK